jgi:hypothetical protein
MVVTSRFLGAGWGLQAPSPRGKGSNHTPIRLCLEYDMSAMGVPKASKEASDPRQAFTVRRLPCERRTRGSA